MKSLVASMQRILLGFEIIMGSSLSESEANVRHYWHACREPQIVVLALRHWVRDHLAKWADVLQKFDNHYNPNINLQYLLRIRAKNRNSSVIKVAREIYFKKQFNRQMGDSTTTASSFAPQDNEEKYFDIRVAPLNRPAFKLEEEHKINEHTTWAALRKIILNKLSLSGPQDARFITGGKELTTADD